MSETPTRAQLEAELAERAHTDPAFHAALQADPTATIRRELETRGFVVLQRHDRHAARGDAYQPAPRTPGRLERSRTRRPRPRPRFWRYHGRRLPSRRRRD